MPIAPDNKDLWLYHVYGGVTKKSSAEARRAVVYKRCLEGGAGQPSWTSNLFFWHVRPEVARITGVETRANLGNAPDQVELVGMVNQEVAEMPALEHLEAGDAGHSGKRRTGGRGGGQGRGTGNPKPKPGKGAKPAKDCHKWGICVIPQKRCFPIWLCLAAPGTGDGTHHERQERTETAHQEHQGAHHHGRQAAE